MRCPLDVICTSAGMGNPLVCCSFVWTCMCVAHGPFGGSWPLAALKGRLWQRLPLY
jgi:hypothetical protein